MRHHRTAQERGMKAEWEANADAAWRRGNRRDLSDFSTN
jgi:hypothetical protein